MNYLELKAAVFSIIKENDPHKATKRLHLKNWCRAFFTLFKYSDKEFLQFFLEVLSDEDSWIETDTIHCIQLNRRKVAQKLIQLQSLHGITNPLDDIVRSRIACWCCLKENLNALFESVKRQHGITNDDREGGRKLLTLLKTGAWSDLLTRYWSHVLNGYPLDLQLLNRKHLYEYGIQIALDMDRGSVEDFRGYVEAVEYFWYKIKQLPEERLSAQRKSEIFMKTTILAARRHCSNNPEIFEFCISQINPDDYLQILRRDFAENCTYKSLNVLRYNRRFDLIKNLFDSFEPSDVSEDTFHELLNMLMLFDAEEYSQFYVDEAVKLLMHIWMKEGFDEHRSSAFRKEIHGSEEQVTLLVSLVKKNYMQPLWTILDQATPDQKKMFMNSTQARYIDSILKERGDQNSLTKLGISLMIFL